MNKFKTYGSLIIGAIFLYDFIITLSSDSGGEHYDVIGFEVSKITYLTYLLAISFSCLTYGIERQFQESDVHDPPISDSM
ncbi:MAG: hypothetical protein GVY08_02565 [Bacteroidetes bacterium]|jgi:hypothetical protein|nr:hypothetical protein [Bacteroidota bacterium]